MAEGVCWLSRFSSGRMSHLPGLIVRKSYHSGVAVTVDKHTFTPMWRKGWRSRVNFSDTCPAQALPLLRCACAAVVDAGGNICGTTYVNTSIRQRASRSVLVLVLLSGVWQPVQAQNAVESFQAYPLRSVKAVDVEGQIARL